MLESRQGRATRRAAADASRRARELRDDARARQLSADERIRATGQRLKRGVDGDRLDETDENDAAV